MLRFSMSPSSNHGYAHHVPKYWWKIILPTRSSRVYATFVDCHLLKPSEARAILSQPNVSVILKLHLDALFCAAGPARETLPSCVCREGAGSFAPASLGRKMRCSSLLPREVRRAHTHVLLSRRCPQLTSSLSCSAHASFSQLMHATLRPL